MWHQIEADQIEKAKYSRSGDTSWSAQNSVGFLYADALVNGFGDTCLKPERADAVGNKTGSVLGGDYTLTHIFVSKFLDAFGSLGICFQTCDNF